jgi:hypothetical protein
MPPKGVITAFIVRAIITIFFGQIVLWTSIRLASLRVRQMKCPSWKDIVRLSSFLRESTSHHATSLCPATIAAHSTLAASAHLSDLSFLIQNLHSGSAITLQQVIFARTSRYLQENLYPLSLKLDQLLAFRLLH